MKSVLVLGSEGFIGGHVKTLLSGFMIYTADVVIGSSDHFILNNQNPDFDHLFEKVKPDYCINASGAADVSMSFNNPELDRKLNATNVDLISKAILKYSPKTKFINLSSAAVYGTPSLLPISEDAPLRPISPYGRHKLESEEIIQDYAVNSGLKAHSLRVFSCYGEGQKKLLLWDIYRKALNSGFKSVELFGTGAESRDYIHVTDLVKVIQVVCENGSFDGTAINAANGVEVTIKDIALMSVNEINETCSLSFSGDERKGDPKRWQADISKLKKLGYTPSVSLIEGLKGYYTWVKTLNF